MATRKVFCWTTLLATVASAVLGVGASANAGDAGVECSLDGGVDCTLTVEGVTQRRVAVTCDSLGTSELCAGASSAAADSVARP